MNNDKKDLHAHGDCCHNSHRKSELKPVPVGAEANYICPMHPQVRQKSKGNCPICGMALDLEVISLDEVDNSELQDMMRRFMVLAFLSAPLAFLIMVGHFIPNFSHEWLDSNSSQWVQMLVATPVVLWGGWPFFMRAVDSIKSRSLNMFTLIALGIGVAYIYSLLIIMFPQTASDFFRWYKAGYLF